MMLNNFLIRIGDALSRNRRTVIKWLLIAAAAMLILAVVYYGVEQLQRSRYEKKVQALEKQFQDAKAEAKAAEDRADAIQVAIETKYEELRHVRIRAAETETLLRNAKTNVVTLKEVYEEIRNNPMPTVDISCADACRQLAAVGYPCQ